MKHFFWIDLEMTGLDVEKEVIIESAALITDLEFNVLDSYESVIHQPQKYIDQMDEWNKTHHGQSGLIDKIPTGKDPEKVESELIELVNKYFPHNEQACIAGNSIYQDRIFIKKYFKNLDARLHYRMLDVSSWKLIFREKYKKEFKKNNTHRALDDIKESISEMKFYMNFLQFESL